MLETVEKRIVLISPLHIKYTTTITFVAWHTMPLTLESFAKQQISYESHLDESIQSICTEKR